MKVLFVVNDLNSGGIENYLLRFLEYYDKKIEPTVFCKSGEFGDLKDKYSKISNVKLIALKISNFSIIDLYRFRSFLKCGMYDSVVDFTGNFAGLPIFVAYTLNIEKRITFYRGSSNHFKENFFKLLYNSFVNKLVYRFSTAILSNSTAALDFFFKNKKDSRFKVIYNGIESSKFLNCKDNLRNELNISNSAFVVGHVGRYAKEKNHEAVFKVACDFCGKYENSYFIMCGKGVDLAFRDRIKELNLDKRVIALGYRDDVIRVLNTLDAFYFPSISEGQPNSLLEALIANLPFVASDIDCIKETVPCETLKYLVNPHDTKTALELLCDILESKKKGDSISFSEWAIKKYDPNILFNEFYQEL